MDTPKIFEIIAKTVDADPSKITLETKLSDLGTDSLDIVEMTLEFENELEREICDDDMSKLQTVQEIVDYINKLS